MFLAYLCSVLRSIIYGSTVFFTGALTKSVDVLDVLALRFLLSFVVLWLLKTLRVIKVDVRLQDVAVKSERTPFLRSLFLAALFEPVLYMVFETVGISMTSNITAGVLLSLAPISSCICESLILKERTSALHKLFLVIRVVGVAYIAVNATSSGGNDTVWGVFFVVLAVFSGSLFGSFSRHSSRAFSAMERTYVSAALGMVVYNAVNVVRHLIVGDILHYFEPFLRLDNLIGFFVLGVMSTIVATGMTNFALSRVHASTLAALGGVGMLTTIVIGVAAGQQLFFYHYIGITCILIGMIGVACLEIKNAKSRS